MKTDKKPFFHHFKAFHNRFIILFLGTLSWFGFYYCYDMPSVIKMKIIEMFQTQNADQAEYYFNLMYSLYSFPNVILPIFSGLLIDRIGYNIPLVLFCALVCVGNVITFFGTRLESIGLMLAGRFLFGIGGESLSISVNSILIAWFKEKELGFSQALSLSLGRAASVLTCFLSPYVVQYGVSTSFGLGVWMCIISLVAAVMAAILDSTAAKSRENASSQVNNQDEAEQQREESFKNIVQQLLKCKAIFWAHVAAICMFYLAYLPFSMVASGFISERWFEGSNATSQEKVEQTGNMLGIPLIVSSILFPVFGLIIDKVGKRLHFLVGSALLLIACYVLFLTTTSIVPLLVLGLAYAIFGATLWPVLAFLVPQRILGTALGLVTIFQNLSMTLFPIFIAYLVSNFNSNLQSMFALLVNSALALVLVGVVWRLDMKSKVSLGSKDTPAILAAVEEEYSKEKKFDSDTASASEEEKISLL